jgi:hypothetical protein
MIKDQVIYLGPRLHAYGIGYGNVFYNGMHPRLKQAIKSCPAIGALVVPVAQTAAVRKELAFDYAHNMRGTAGKFVAFYSEVQQWLNSHNKQPKPKSIEVNTHAKSRTI